MLAFARGSLYNAGPKPGGTRQLRRNESGDIMSEKIAGNTAPRDVLAQVEELIGEELLEVERILADELDSSLGCVRDILQHVTRFRGKRLRPILLLLTGEAVGGITSAHRVLAAVVEMIHIATLVHDDVLDDATTRRHVATVNSRWNNETSVLFGDFLFTHAFHLASSLETTHACRLIGRATNIVCEGELLQIHERGNFELTEERYLRIIDGKTAELCAVCTHLGAHYADGDETTVRALEEYGRLLGRAFQVADDLLDLTGSERNMGKTLGSDLRKQKLTLPLIRLLDQIGEAEGQTVRQWLSQPDEQTPSQLLPYLKQTDAIQYTCSRAAEFAAAARHHLHPLPDSPAKRLLEEIAEFAVQRST